MAIFAYVGLPGSGKSHTVVEHQILPALRAKRRVVTNVPMHMDKVSVDFPGAELVELPLDKVMADPGAIYDYVTPGSVLVLDEVWRIFPAGDKANKVPEPYRKLLAEHRHMVNAKGQSCQIVLVTQDLGQISRFARLLVEQTFRTVKLTTVGLNGQYRLDIFRGPVEGPNPPEARKDRQIFGRYHEGVWRYYKSHTMSQATEAGADERPMDKRGNILRSPFLAACALLCVAGAFWVVPKIGQVFSRDAGLLGAQKVTERVPLAGGATESRSTAAGTTAAVRLASSGPPVARGPDTDYRIAAVVRVADDDSRSRVIVTDGQRRFTIPYEGSCYTTPDGRTFCDFQGVEVGEYALVARGGPSPSPNRVAQPRSEGA